MVAVAARLEAELADLEPDEAAVFRAELGADEEGAIGVFLRAAYEVLGYITFFTGDFRSSETRAGNCPAAGRPSRRRGASTATSSTASCAPRSSVVNSTALRSFHAAREKALQRTEGKDYVVQDGDVINFMHTG